MQDLIIPNTGAIKSPPDHRDFKLSKVASAIIPETLPESCFIDVSMLPVWHQRKIGACVGHAWAKSQQYCEFVERGVVINLSARFLYAMSKCLDGYEGEGTYPRLTAKILKDYGCATEDIVPNDTTLSHEEYVYGRKIDNIPAEAFGGSKKYGIAGYAFSETTEQGIKEAIYYAKTKRQGIVMLMRVGNTYWTAPDGTITWDKNKILPIARPKTISSGHEIYPIGYEYKNGRFVVHFLNSWSKDWADEGKGWFYYDEHSDLIDEVMTSIDKTDVPSPVFKNVMKIGEHNDDIMLMQAFFLRTGLMAPIPEGEFGWYGKKTASAVLAFQIKYCNLSWYERYIMRGNKVGPKTLLQLNLQYK